MVLHMQIPIIGMSGNRYAPCKIQHGAYQCACGKEPALNLAPTSSTTATLTGRRPCCGADEGARLQPRDFAQFHPGGSLGKRLLTTAEDVMRSDDLPVLTRDMNLGDAIILVSKGKGGLGVAMEENRVVGLITDGDIRRAMEKWKEHSSSSTWRTS